MKTREALLKYRLYIFILEKRDYFSKTLENGSKRSYRQKALGMVRTQIFVSSLAYLETHSAGYEFN